MIKIQNNTATREPLPAFLVGLAPESLADLSWTDPALGVQDVAWWPEVHLNQPLSQNQKYGAESFVINASNQTVEVTREVLDMTEEEIKGPVPSTISPFQAKAALAHAGMLDVVEAAMASADLLVRLAWEEVTEFRRDSPTVLSMGASFGLTSAQLDDLFRYGATVKA